MESPLETNFKKRIKKTMAYGLASLSAVILSVGVYAGIQLFTKNHQLDNPAVADNKPPLLSDSSLQQLKKSSEGFRAVAKLVGPAVVNIKATKGVKAQQPKGALRGRKPKRGQPQAPPQDEDQFHGGGDPFFDFFERFGMPFNMPQEQAPQTSLGSGIIIDKKGHIVTNNHVVDDASEILVILADDKTELKAKVVGTDPKTDLAVLKVTTDKDLPSVEWADSDSVEVGDWAIAIGSPFALSQSVTVGIVSAKGRNSLNLTGAEYGGDLIQTDAAINPGNSGGPLVTLEGRVMGVNTAIYTRSGGYMGIGFAIPSNTAKDISTKLISDGKIVRGWLGVFIQPLDKELAKELDLKEGVGIHEVIEESPAAVAGLKAGDVIVEVDGKAVKETAQLQKIISGFKPGESVKLKVVSYTDKKARTVTVKIGNIPEGEPQGKAAKEESAAPDKIGLVLSKGKEGLTVEAIQPGSMADQVGLEQGDILVRVNRKEVKTLEAYKKIVDSSKRLYLEVKRRGRTLFYQFVLPE
ncbi:MAG: Do family serine endopeptidase [Deltaproteobacteria bacterium]|nr:Do family serine endopeptidase [Deltaproteobacteria bacterium]MBI3293960.1 Do family serine endopeptidase [Deltaproteobacteria bacterium]